MAVLIDYVNHSLEELRSTFDSIQKRYLDPYKVRLSTTTNNYVFVEKDINKMVSKLYGNNTILEGLRVTNISYASDHVDITVEKGSAICDNTVIEFTQDMIIRVPKNWLNTSNDNYNVVVIDYNHAETYPPRVAYIIAFEYKSTVPYQVSTIVNVFKTNGSSTTYQNPDINGNLVEDLTLTINGNNLSVTPSAGTALDVVNTARKIVGAKGVTPTRAEFEALAELRRRVFAGSGFVDGNFEVVNV
jgi:hypothetical protein